MAFTPRTPYGIRRHYSAEEEGILTRNTTPAAARITRRPYNGLDLKRKRLQGTLQDTHHKDGTGKYRSQEHTQAHASRHGMPWQEWEDFYLLDTTDREDLRTKALRLMRTYRAAESRRRDLLRQLN